jgi:hypothetical protein
MELIGIGIVVLGIIALVWRLERTARRTRVEYLDVRTRHEMDRDIERIRADLFALPDQLANRPLWQIRPSPLTGTDEWTRQA